jgi:L-seryl-tRNA(Ser) seleniumtransferase
MVGGGSMPEETIETFVLKINSNKYKAWEIEKSLRKNIIPIITRVNKEQIIMDLRTIDDDDFNVIAEAFKVMDKL